MALLPEAFKAEFERRNPVTPGFLRVYIPYGLRESKVTTNHGLKYPGGLKPEVKEWLVENCKGAWTEKYELVSPWLEFADERDAVLFKTAWF